jgi:ribosomal protein L22
MPYTFVPKQRHAKLFSHANISTKHATKLCAVIRGKKLTTARRLLEDLKNQRRSLDGKFYTKASCELLKLLQNCVANAENLGLDTAKLFVHASAHKGPILRRARRKASFGSRMKSTNIELMLIERGR